MTTKCVEPDAEVYGTMGSYGIYQKQEQYIESSKISLIRAAANGYISADSAAEQIIRLQTQKPFSSKDGERMAKLMSDGVRQIAGKLLDRQ